MIKYLNLDGLSTFLDNLKNIFADKNYVDTHMNDTAVHVTAEEKKAWSSIEVPSLDGYATEEYVETLYTKLNTNTILGFYCIEDVTIVINGISKVYPANSNVEIKFIEDDVFEIIPTSDNSIMSLTAFPGALGTYYPWLEGVKQFSNILFDMNNVDFYSKWSQGNQGAYQVQFAQYVNCIFWSDNTYVSDVNKRTNYTLYYTSQLPLCYSSIPDNTFKAFFLAFGVNSDPNWGNPAYRESFAKATWATQAFSYYGARTIGIFGHDDPDFNITLPEDCRGLMYQSTAIENAGTFDAINVTNFGAKSGSWRDAFGYCSSLRNLFIKNLKVNLNISWSPINYESIYFIISKAANTNAITISVSPYTYNLLSPSDFELATSKNITIELITTNYVEDRRLSAIADKADKSEVPTNLVNGSATGSIRGIAAAIEDDSYTIGVNAFAIGNGNKASGKNSFASGQDTVASGSYSHVEGYGCTATAAAAHAEGYDTHATARYAHAEGASTTASGNNSHAEGNSTTSSGHYSHAEGNFTTAAGAYSHAEGNYTQTTDNGTYSHVEGSYTKATKTGAHAEGNYTEANGAFSHTEGLYTKSASMYQHVRGKYNIVDDANVYATIVGNGVSEDDRKNIYTLDWNGEAWYSGDIYVGSTSGKNKDEGSKKLATEEFVLANSNPDVLLKTEQTLTDEELTQVRNNLKFIGKDVEGQSFVINGETIVASANAEIFGDYENNKCTGQWSIVEGSTNIATGRACHVEGAQNQALNDGCHVEGVSCIASGFWSHAEGEMTRVTSYASHAEGSYTKMPDGTIRYGTASGYASHIEGGGCHAQGSCSHSEGLATTTKGKYSHSEGRHTIAGSDAQHVEGASNIEDTEGKYIHIAGNGEFGAPSNAHTLDWDGNAEFAGDVIANGCSSTETPISLIDICNRTSSLETAMADIEDISSGEIQALFV